MANFQISVPAGLAESAEWSELADDERRALLVRLEEAFELADSLESGQRLIEYPEFARLFEDIEFDIASLQELPSTGFSRWIIHYCWTFEPSQEELLSAIPPSLRGLIDRREPGHDAGREEVITWLKQSGQDIKDSILAFSSANNYAASVALHILIDILLARLLLGCYKLRLSYLLSWGVT